MGTHQFIEYLEEENMIKLNKVYTHRKGVDVFTERFCEIKIDGVWVSGIAYSEGMSLWVRTLEDFESSFKPKNWGSDD